MLAHIGDGPSWHVFAWSHRIRSQGGRNNPAHSRAGSEPDGQQHFDSFLSKSGQVRDVAGDSENEPVRNVPGDS